MGSYIKQYYMSDIRQKILDMEHPKEAFIKYTGKWHFENIVYKHQVRNIELTTDELKADTNNTRLYNMILLKSKYSLCPSGSGPNSIRFWESLAVGSIPVLLADTLELPKHDLWDKAILKIKEKDVNTIPNILSNISEEKEIEMRKNCLIIYNDLKDNFLNISNE